MHRKTAIVAALAGACLSISSVSAGPNPAMKRARPQGSPDGPITIFLSNAVVGDGHLDVSPDPMGGVTTGFGLAGNNDTFDPAGAEPPLSPSFASNLFLYAPATQDRVSLAHATSPLWSTYPQPPVPPPPVIAVAVTSPLAGSDFDGDGTVDTADSAFTVTGGAAALSLSVTLKQRVYKPAAGTSVPRFRQTWTFTNNAAAAASLKFVRHSDLDILATPLGLGSFEDVAGSFDQPGCAPINPYQREPSPEPPTTPIAFGMVAGTPGGVYYAGRSGYDPDGGGPDPAMAFGTDFQIWNAYGLPVSWENQTAFIGAAPLTGEDPLQFPIGGIAPFDGFMGIQWTVSIPPGGTQAIDVTTFYGARSGYVCYPDANCSGTLTVADFGAFQTAFVAGNMYADCNNSGTLTVGDFGCFQTAFVAGCN